MRGKVNSMLMTFLYQSRNAGKDIILLTKHAADIAQSLDRYAISPQLFSEIIHLEQGEDKTPYIRPDSIFIDDSFAERKAVHDKCGVPVFDLDMVESLLDWHA